MEVQQRRMIGALLILLGISLLAVGVYSGQLSTITDLLRKVFMAQ